MAPRTTNSKRNDPRPLGWLRHAPPHREVGTFPDRFLDQLTGESNAHGFRTICGLAPQRERTDVGIVATLLPAWAITRPRLKPSPIVASTVDTVQVRPRLRAGVQENVGIISRNAQRNYPAMRLREPNRCSTVWGIMPEIAHQTNPPNVCASIAAHLDRERRRRLQALLGGTSVGDRSHNVGR